MHEHVVTVDHEGIEGAVVDDVDVDALSSEACGGEDRFGVDLEQRFRLGIADHTGWHRPWWR